MKPMATALFSPSTWRKKKRSLSSQHCDGETSVPPSPSTSGFHRLIFSPSKLSLSDRGDNDSSSDSSSTLVNTSCSDHVKPPLRQGLPEHCHRLLDVQLSPSPGSPPRRPPRPPNLNLDIHAPLLSSSTSCPLSLKSPRTPTRDVYAPHISPSISCPVSPGSAEFEESPPANSLLKSKRSMPQLDGVWKGFLEEVNEDPRTLCMAPKSDSKSHCHSRSASRHRTQLADMPSSPKARSTHDLTVTPSVPPPLPYRRSRSSSRSPCPDPESVTRSNVPEFTADLTLSFPAPPPLFIRRKHAPLPALRPTPSRARVPASPNISSSDSSSDSTPVATPITATPAQSPPKVGPLSIIKKSCPSSPSHVYAFPLSPSPSLPSPAVHYPDQPPVLQHSRSLRLVQSTSHLPHSQSSACHRTSNRPVRSRTNSTKSTSGRRSTKTIPESPCSYTYSPPLPRGQGEWGIGVAF